MNRKGLGGREEIQLFEVIRIVARYKVLIAILCAIVVMIAVTDYFLFPVYKARASLSIHPNNSLTQSVSTRLGSMYPTDMMASQIERYLTHLNAFDFYQNVAKKVRETPELQALDPEIFGRRKAFSMKIKRLFSSSDAPMSVNSIPEEALAETIAHHTTMSTVGQDIINIFVTAPNRKLAQTLANELVKSAVETLTELDEKELKDTQGYIKILLGETEEAIAKIDEEIAGSGQSGQFLAMAKEDSARRALTLQEEIYQFTAQVDQMQVKLEELSKGDPTDSQAIGGYRFSRSQRVQELKRQIEETVRKRDAAKAVLRKMSKNYDPHFEQRIFGLRRKLEMEYALFENLSKEMFETQVRRISVKDAVRIYETSREDDVYPSHGLGSTILIALIMALLVATPLAYIWELIAPTVRGRGELDDLGLIFLGGIPRIRSHKNWRGLTIPTRYTEEIPLCRFDSETSTSLAFTSLRTRLLALGAKFGESSQTIAVMSPELGDGKSHIARNVAAALAYRKQRTLLIDCDMRWRSTTSFFRQDKAKGLGEVLLDEIQLEAMEPYEVAPYLDLLPAGHIRSDITEILTLDYFKQVLAELSKTYVHIVIDTPPINLVPDAMLLSRFVDQIIMVSMHHQTRISALAQSIATVSEMAERRIYSVLNGFEGDSPNLFYLMGSTGQSDASLPKPGEKTL